MHRPSASALAPTGRKYNDDYGDNDVQITDVNKGTKTDVARRDLVTDLPGATRMVSIGCLPDPTNDGEPRKVGRARDTRDGDYDQSNSRSAGFLAADGACETRRKVFDGVPGLAPEEIAYLKRHNKFTMFTIECVSAVDIQDLSQYSHEKESLLPPGTELKVVSSAKKGSVHHIKLVEVGQAKG